MNISNLLIRVLNSICSSYSEKNVLQTLLCTTNPPVKLFCRFSRHTIAYPNLGFDSSYLALLVPMSANFRPHSHHTVLWKFHSSLFITKFILIAIFLVCLMSLLFLSINTDYLISNIIISACSGTIYGYLFANSFFSILSCSGSIPVVHATLYSLSTLDWATLPGTCIQWSISTTW